MTAGARRQPWATIVTLLCSWSGLGYLFLLGVVVGVGFLGLLAYVFVGRLTPNNLPLRFLYYMLLGAVVSQCIVVVVILVEPWTLRLRGYRRLSDREARKIEPLLNEVAERMGFSTTPGIWASDVSTPGAWTYTRSIVLSSAIGLHDEHQDFDRDELCALLAHELQHWASADVVADRFAWACALPIAAPYNLRAWLQRQSTALGALAMLALWPTSVLLRVVIAPLIAMRGRVAEYDADAAAAAAGYQDAMRRVLERLHPFEPPRSGWEEVLASTHPPVELRLEALDAEISASPPNEDELGHRRRAPYIAGGATVAVISLVALVPHIARSASTTKSETHATSTVSVLTTVTSEAVVGEPTAFAQSRDGAIATAAAYDHAYITAFLDDAAFNNTVNTIGAARSRAALLAQGATQRQTVTASQTNALVSNEQSLAYQVASYSDSTAQIRVYNTAIIASNSGAVSTQSTDTLTLGWESGAWKLSSLSSQSGPDSSTLVNDLPPGYTSYRP